MRLIQAIRRLVEAGEPLAEALLIPAVLGNVLWALGTLFVNGASHWGQWWLTGALAFYLAVEFASTQVGQENLKCARRKLKKSVAKGKVTPEVAETRRAAIKCYQLCTLWERLTQTPALAIAALAASNMSWVVTAYALSFFSLSLFVGHLVKRHALGHAKLEIDDASATPRRQDKTSRCVLAFLCLAHGAGQLAIARNASRWCDADAASAVTCLLLVAFAIYWCGHWHHRTMSGDWEVLHQP